jgi:peptide/nickel transport system permease protein
MRPEESMFQLFLRRFRRHRLAVASALVLFALAAICFIVPVFVSEDAANVLDLEGMFAPPSLKHPFGMDAVGRDVFMRCIYGGRISLRIGILAAMIAIMIGITVGAVSGYNTGLIDNVLMRFTEALMSIPTLFILIVLGRILGPSIAITTVIIGALAWMGTARIVRAEILSLKEQDFVLAARATGVPSRRILVGHLLPNVIAPIVVSATLRVGQAIIMEASLSFLGLGVQPPTATWGNMLTRAQGHLRNAPWIAVFPGLLILITVLCINFIGDGLRDAMDPHALR